MILLSVLAGVLAGVVIFFLGLKTGVKMTKSVIKEGEILTPSLFPSLKPKKKAHVHEVKQPLTPEEELERLSGPGTPLLR